MAAPPVLCTVGMNVAGVALPPVTIQITPTEAQLFRLLRSVVSATGCGTAVRVAGGWVRDKLLGRDNHDIDLALDNQTGRQFAELVNEHLRASGERVSAVAVILANPGQSKHLETATTKVFGMMIDFVNLRCEEYDAGSRIPRAIFGTPLQDAERRDFTVNALFYNVSTNEIEDLTGQGVSDLRAGILRTPIDPAVTFIDDPLRVLRALRFASRFCFRMAPELRAAAADARIHDALALKVSRSRVGSEVDAMLSGDRPLSSARLLNAFGLLRAICEAAPLLADAGGRAPATATSAPVHAGTMVSGKLVVPPVRRALPTGGAAAQGWTAATLQECCHLTAADAVEVLRHAASGIPAGAADVGGGSAADVDGGGAYQLPGAAWVAISSLFVSGLHEALRLEPGLVALLSSSAPSTVEDPPPPAAVVAAAHKAAPAAAAAVVVASGAHPAPARASSEADKAPDSAADAACTTVDAFDAAMALDGDRHGAAAAAAPLAPAAAGSWPAVIPTLSAACADAAVAPSDSLPPPPLGEEELPDALQRTAGGEAGAAAAAVPRDVNRILLYAALLLPLAHLQTMVPPTPTATAASRGKAPAAAAARRAEPLLSLVLTERLCRRHRDGADVAAVAAGAAAFAEQVAAGPDRLAVGRLLRGTCRGMWPAALVLSAAAHTAAYLDASPGGGCGARAPSVHADLLPAARACLAAHLALARDIVGSEWRMAGCWATRPLLDGTQLMALLGLRGGPALRALLEAGAEWQLMHPEGTAQQAAEHLAAMHRHRDAAAAAGSGAKGGGM